MKIVVIRHGQTKANVINNGKTAFYTGALNNELTDLTEEGKSQARRLTNNKFIRDIQKVYSSDLNRSIETAKLAKPGYKVYTCKELRERSLGIFEGKQEKDLLNSKEYKKYILDDKFNKYRADFIQKAPEGENYTEVSKRCMDFLKTLDFSEDKTIGVFSHLIATRCLFFDMFNIPKEKIFKLKIEHCIPYVIEGKDINNLKLISHNLDDMFME